MNRSSAACWTRRLGQLSACFCLAALGHAQVFVPGSFSTPQAAIDGSPAESTIIVAGGTWGPLTIDKAITLIGHPAPTFVADDGPNFHYNGQDPAIFLDGPGSGQVTLVNVICSASFMRFLPSGSSISRVTPGIAGGGFDELHVYDCTISAVEWDRSILTGVGLGEPGIELGREHVAPTRLWVQGSLVRGGQTSDDGFLDTIPPTNPGAISSDGDVVLIDSTIIGGSYIPQFVSILSPDCFGTVGGVAVDCEQLYDSGSLLLAGQSAFYTEVPSGNTCQAPPGPNLDVSRRISGTTQLFLQGRPRVGRRFSVLWNLPACASEPMLIITEGFGSQLCGSFGTLFLNLTPGTLLNNITIRSGPTGIVDLHIPDDARLIGFEAAFQVFVPGGAGMSSPLGVVVLP